MNIYLVCETCQYEGIQQIIKVFDSRPKAEKFIINTEEFIAKNRSKQDELVEWHQKLINNKIFEITGIPIPKNVLNNSFEYHSLIPYDDFCRIDEECANAFTAEERKIFEFDFNNNKLEITEMEVE